MSEIKSKPMVKLSGNKKFWTLSGKDGVELKNENDGDYKSDKGLLVSGRNTLKHVAEKDKKAFANGLKTIYHASDDENGYANMLKVKEKWESKYPNAMNR